MADSIEKDSTRRVADAIEHLSGAVAPMERHLPTCPICKPIWDKNEAETRERLSAIAAARDAERQRAAEEAAAAQVMPTDSEDAEEVAPVAKPMDYATKISEDKEKRKAGKLPIANP